MVKMKSHIFKEDGIHYYLEVSIGKRKFIIDNFSCIYGYNEYRNRFKPKQIETIQQKEIVEDVVEDYAEIVRKAREKTGMSQSDFAKKINEKEGAMHNIETGKIMPNLKLARKLEVALRIKLIEVIEERHNITNEKPKSNELTLGDVIKIKKR